jgi:hypothetical protein
MRSRRLASVVVLLALLLPGLALRTAGAAAAGECDAAKGETYFPETKHCVPKLFYDYWTAHGGLAQQGLPVSDDFSEISAADGKTYTVQYFERARFESHPESKDPQYKVLLGLVGSEQYKARYPSGAPGGGQGQQAACEPGEQLFAQTGYCVPAIFYAYWLLHGDLAQQGLPLSPAFMETNPSDGKQYLTQYFERARFEYHPESKELQYQVLLGLLGNEQYDGKYPGITPIEADSLTDPTINPLDPVDTADAQARYDQGGYRITVKTPNRYQSVLYWPSNTSPIAAVNRLGLSDERIEVEATRLAGPDDGTVSLYCRAQKDNPDKYYLFQIGPGDGYYWIAVFFGPGEQDNKTIAGGDNAPRLPAAKVGSAPTRLRADCIGDTLTLYVNGQKIAEGHDTTLATGQGGGFDASTYLSGGMDVVFRNFTFAIPHR